MTFASREFIIAGPPGCGKSTYVMRQAAKAVDKYGPEGVMVCSMTKAAANEIALRNACMNPQMVGTLHSHCFHGLGRPKLAETREGLRDWNEQHRTLQIGMDAASTEEDCGVREYKDNDKAPGTALLQAVNLHRARMIDEKLWQPEERRFFKMWSEWKDASGLYDFADLIEQGIRRLHYAPGNPSVIFVDEAQDISRAEYELVRRWGGKTQQCVIVGDRDQSLYHWRGADAGVVDISRLPDSQVRVLDQSYRVPRAVHAEAMRVISHCADRVPVSYKPVDKDGFVERSAATLYSLDSLSEYIDSDKTVMLLTSCSYMLNNITKKLKEWGIPYGNQYSERWNPIGKRAIQLYTYLQPSQEHNSEPSFWTVKDIKYLCSDMRAKDVFVRGRKKEIDDLDDDMPAEDLALTLRDLFLPDAIQDFLSLVPERFTRLYPSRLNFDYPLAILNKYGRDELVNQPRVTVGTIHSVKGGEADIVILFPDMSRKGFMQSRKTGWGGSDAVLRMFYVGITRAREGVVFCRPSSELYERRL